MESETEHLLAFPFLFLIPLQGAPLIGLIVAIIFIVLLLLCSALISSSEVAFFSLTPNDFKTLEEEQTATSERILQLRDIPRRLLATILISNNFINIAIVILSDFVLRNSLPEQSLIAVSTFFNETIGLSKLGISISTNALNFLITVVGVTFLLVLFGEVAPKIYAKLNNLKLARFMSQPLLRLNSFFSPFSRILIRGTNVIEKRLAKRTHNGSSASAKEISQAIELTVNENEKHGKRDIDILKGIVKFGDVSVKQIMKSRLDVIAIDFRTSYEELLKIVKDTGFSRIPVYDEDFDNVTGMLFTKDLIGHLNEEKNYEWQTLIRPSVYYVPEAKKINELMKDFQDKRSHMAIVVDEYGGTSGIVTLEDVMEEVIGDIKDEFDDKVEIEYVKIDPFNYIFEGKTLINDICRIIEVDTEIFDPVRGDADSVAGLVLEMHGFIPKINTEVDYNGYRFKIVEVDKRRIKQVKMTLPQNNK